MNILQTRVFAVILLVLSLSACGPRGGMMGHMSGQEMMQMMRDPAVMNDWMEAMTEDPDLMATMMVQMQRRLRDHSGGQVPLYCPMMGFTPENPPAPEPGYEPGSLSGRQLFEIKCSRCHALPDSGQHTAAEWEQTVERMGGYMESVSFASASADELAAIRGYLETSSGR